MPATPAVEMVAPTTESTANSIAVQDTTEKELENYTKVDKPESEIQNDMIPEELLFALTHVPQPETKTRLPDLKKDKTLQEIIKKGSPANVWNYKTRRMQYKHLTDNPRSDGKSAGTRDVSFLYDIQSHTGPPPKPPGGKFDKSSGRLEALENSNQKPTESNLAVPESIIPDEYHVVKSKAVLGLEYIDQSLTTNLEDREKTLRVFPSLNPTKRHEVVQLLKTLDYMLEKSGVDDEDVEIKGPTQVHNLIELIKKEQNVYDLVFAEVIRQVSVGCIERGQLLSKLRQKYADLLNRVPRQIRSLHVEVMAQRSLDRRLTEELLRFKTSITFLTNELQQVRAHDEQVTADAQRAEMDLAQALKESQTNANLVDEYHTLYELQRRRLEAQVNSLGNERDVWSNAAYSLSLKIMTVNSLKTAKRLHVSEKAWSKLASHFAVMLNDRDSGSLGVLQKIVERWRELMFSFNQSLTFVDKQTTSALDQIKQGIQKWIKIFDDTLIVVTSDVRSIRIPPMEMLHRLQESIREWEENLNRHIEQFGGDNLLNNQEQLTNMMKLTEEWTDVALKVYRRHKIGDQEIHPLAETMKDVNEILHLLNKQLKIRISGENGLARHMITFHMIIDSLSNKFHIAASNNESFSDSEWLQMYEKLHDYVNQLNEAISLVGEQQRDEDRTNKRPHTRIHIEEAMGKVQGWLKSSLNGIEAEDGKMIAQSSSIHNKLVGWMVQALLHLAPNFQRDADDFPVENSFISSCTETELKEKAEDISSHLATFTGYLSQCCQHIVEETAEEKRQEGEEEADYEFRDFIRLKREAREWIRTAEIILTTISKEPIKILRPEMDEVLRIERDAKTDTTPRHDSIEVFRQRLDSRRRQSIAAAKMAKEAQQRGSKGAEDSSRRGSRGEQIPEHDSDVIDDLKLKQDAGIQVSTSIISKIVGADEEQSGESFKMMAYFTSSSCQVNMAEDEKRLKEEDDEEEDRSDDFIKTDQKKDKPVLYDSTKLKDGTAKVMNAELQRRLTGNRESKSEESKKLSRTRSTDDVDTDDGDVIIKKEMRKVQEGRSDIGLDPMPLDYDPDEVTDSTVERGRVYTRGGKERKDTGTSPSSHGSRQGAVSKQGRKKRKTKETESPKIRDQGSDTEIATEETVKKPEMTPQAPEVTPQAPEVTPKELEVKPEVAPPMTADVTSQPAPVQDEAETSVVASMSENEVQPSLTTDAVKPTEEDVSSVVDTPKPVADESSTTLINPAQTIEVIGADENTESATLSDATSSKNLISPASSLTQSAYDSIAKMDQLQNELIITEERAQKAEDRVNELEANLNGANEKIRALEKQVAELMKQLKNTKESPEAEVVADSSSQKLTEDDSSKAGGKSLEGRKSSTPSRQSTSSQQKHRKSKSKKQ